MATMNAVWLADPLDTDTPSFGDDEIVATRVEFYDRLVKEHEMGGTTIADGAHKEGSARAYYQATEPTLRPDGSTNLDSDDDGRLYIDSDDNTIEVWNGSAFADISIGGNAATADLVTLATTATGVNDVGGGNDLLVKIIEIGDWNMDSTGIMNVLHGLTFADIISSSVIIRNDNNDQKYPGLYGTFTDPLDIRYYILGSNVSIIRRSGGIFDATTFNATSFNRGWVTIWYQP